MMVDRLKKMRILGVACLSFVLDCRYAVACVGNSITAAGWFQGNLDTWDDPDCLHILMSRFSCWESSWFVAFGYFQCCKFCSCRWFDFFTGFREAPFNFDHKACHEIFTRFYIFVLSRFGCHMRSWVLTGLDAFCAVGIVFNFQYRWGSFHVRVQTCGFLAFFVFWRTLTFFKAVVGYKGSFWTRDYAWLMRYREGDRFRGWCNFIAWQV